MIPRGISALGRLAYVAIGLVASALLPEACGRGAPSPAPLVRTVTAAELLARMGGLQLDAGGIRRTLEGKVDRQPAAITRADTLLEAPPETVFVAVRVDAAGDAFVGQLREVDGGWQPELLEAIPLGDCDDGWSIGPDGAVCDRARLGHLTAFVGAGAAYPIVAASIPRTRPTGRVGLRWAPSYRSLWMAELAATTEGEIRMEISRGIRLW